MQFYKRSGDFDYYTSDILSSLWSDSSEYQMINGKKCYVPRGFCVVAPASWETAAYTARYVTKKLYGADTVIYDNLGVQPEFAVMSRRPGLASDFLIRMLSIYLILIKYLFQHLMEAKVFLLRSILSVSMT